MTQGGGGGGGGGGVFENILAHFQDIQARWPPREYFPDPTKSILVVAPRNVPREEELFRGMGENTVTGSRYLGVFVGDGAAEESWIDEKVEGLAESMRTLLEVSWKQPQSAYARLQK